MPLMSLCKNAKSFPLKGVKSVEMCLNEPKVRCPTGQTLDFSVNGVTFKKYPIYGH